MQRHVARGEPALQVGTAAYNISVAEGYMDNYVDMLRKKVHERFSLVFEMTGITPELAKVAPEVAQAWLKALEAEGAIVGNTPYQVRHGELRSLKKA
jgi:hypothetical protein